ncbi:MAG: response regulator [Anaerolineales bacterium]|nr:response regulator [Anaerolineales bacterium]
MAAKIFLIEDDLTMQALLQTYLQFEGFEVMLQNKEEKLDEVVANIRREMPDIVLLDVYLPQVNGFDLLAAMRGDSELKELRVVMTSGMDFNERCLREGANAFILKPYMPDDLVKTIRRTLGTESD